MIDASQLRRTLRFLDCQYRRHFSDKDVTVPTMFSKLALLEYCGWLEETFDEIARHYVSRRLNMRQNKVLEEKIHKIRGVNYSRSAQPLLAFALGLPDLLRIERDLDQDGSLERLKGSLTKMGKRRNEAAHTFTKDRTSNFDSPDIIIADLDQTEVILLRLWKLANARQESSDSR